METQAEYEVFPRNEYKLPHGVVSWQSSEDPAFPGLKILLDGEIVMVIEEDVRVRQIQAYMDMPSTGSGAHVVLKQFPKGD